MGSLENHTIRIVTHTPGNTLAMNCFLICSKAFNLEQPPRTNKVLTSRSRFKAIAVSKWATRGYHFRTQPLQTLPWLCYLAVGGMEQVPPIVHCPERVLQTIHHILYTQIQFTGSAQIFGLNRLQETITTHFPPPTIPSRLTLGTHLVRLQLLQVIIGCEEHYSKAMVSPCYSPSGFRISISATGETVEIIIQKPH